MTKSMLKWKASKAFVLVRGEMPVFLATTLGCILYAIGVAGFTIPYKFPDSGVTGVAILVDYAIGLSPVWIIIITNAIFIIWGWRELSPRFVMWSIYGVVLFTILLSVFRDLPYPVVSDKLLVAIFAGVIRGLGSGLVFRAGASMGGTDVVVSVLRKRYGIEVGMYTFYINLVILSVSSFIVGFDGALFGLIGVYTSSVTADSVLRSFDRRTLVFIVANNEPLVEDYVINQIHRGVTVLEAKGGYSGEPKPTLMCLMSRRQAVDLKRYLALHDPRTFMVLTDASEVRGRGFKGWKEI